MRDYLGLHRIRLPSGDVQLVNIASVLYDGNGYPIFLTDDKGVDWNWANVVSIEKLSTETNQIHGTSIPTRW